MSKQKNQKAKNNNASQPVDVFEASPWKLYLQVTLFTLGLGLVGVVSYPFFTALSIKMLNKVEIVNAQVDTKFNLQMLYIAAFVLVPLMTFASQKLLKLTSIAQKIFIIVSVFVSGIIFWMLQISSLNQQYQQMLKIKTPFPMKYTFALESLFLEFNLLVGFIVGAIVGTILIYRFNKRLMNVASVVPKNQKVKR